MSAPNYEQVQSFGHVSAQLREAAIDEFMERIDDSMSIEEIMEQAVEVARKFSYLGMELGAQWYDLCTELAGISAEPAEIGEVDDVNLMEHAKATVKASSNPDIRMIFDAFLQNQINDSIRRTGSANLWRDYNRGLTSGRWARVPVGETCAWCLMLASQGAWYLSEESALGKSAGHYHNDCNCIAVYHATPESIGGYSKLQEYKRMYYDADNARIANAKGIEEYPEELQQRIARAKIEHAARYADGATDKKWSKWNETLIVMRYQHPGMH